MHIIKIDDHQFNDSQCSGCPTLHYKTWVKIITHQMFTF